MKGSSYHPFSHRVTLVNNVILLMKVILIYSNVTLKVTLIYSDVTLKVNLPLINAILSLK